MNLTDYIEKVVKQARQLRMAESDQLTLGALIDKISAVERKDVNVLYDFADTHPTTLHSWRGSYEELAMDFDYEGNALNVTDFLALLTSAIGKTFTGWKGGDYVMDRDTPIWVSRPERGSHTAIIDVVDDSYVVYLITALREF